MKPAEIAEKLQSFVASVDPEDADLGALKARLNTFMRILWHIEWWGQFKELIEGRKEFAIQLRRSFFEEIEETTENTISRNLMGEFKEYLHEYGT